MGTCHVRAITSVSVALDRRLCPTRSGHIGLHANKRLLHFYSPILHVLPTLRPIYIPFISKKELLERV